MTNREKLKEVFPYTIFIYRKEDDKTNAIMCSDEWLDSEYIEPQESNDKCKNCEYYRNPDYTRCHECKAESEDKE